MSTVSVPLFCSAGRSEAGGHDRQLDLIGEQQALARGRLGHDPELHARVGRLLAPVAVEAFQRDALAVAALLEAERAGADRRIAVGGRELARLVGRDDRRPACR